MAIAQQYIDQAAQLAGQGKAQKLADLQTNYDTGVNGYNSQEGTLNKQYTANVDAQNMNTAFNKNNYNNNVLARGLGRSSIATTGLAGIDNTNSRILSTLLNNKNEATNAIETLKNQLRDRLGRDQSAVNTDYNTEVQNRALQLQQYADDQAYKERQFAEQQRQFNLQQALEQQKLAIQKQQQAAAVKKAQEDSANMFYSKFTDLVDTGGYTGNTTTGNGVAKQMLSDNKNDIIGQYGKSFYDTLAKYQFNNQPTWMRGDDGRMAAIQSNSSKSTTGTRMGGRIAD